MYGKQSALKFSTTKLKNWGEHSMYDAADTNSKFLEAINRAALKNCQTLEEEIEAQTRAEMAKAEKKIHEECHQKMEKETQKRKSATVRQLAEYSSEKSAALSHRRQEIENQVFAAAQQELAAYRDTAAYQDSLLRSAQAMKPLFADAADIVIFLAASDLSLASQLKAALGAHEVCADQTNKLGGMKAQSLSHKLVIDDTIASRLEAQRQWFAAHSNLKIV